MFKNLSKAFKRYDNAVNKYVKKKCQNLFGF